MKFLLFKGSLVRGVIIIIFLTLLLEGFLRFFPQIISLPLLVRFHPELRFQIADRLGLPNIASKREVKTDEGRILKVFRPFAKVLITIHEGTSPTDITMDENGFCNPSAEQKNYDVVVLGDSVTWCTTVKAEETWPYQLHEVSGKSVYNLGHPGFGIFEYLDLLKAFGLAKTPKVVIMGIYEGNDYQDAVNYHSAIAGVDPGGQSEWPCALPESICPYYRMLKNSSVGNKSYSFNFFVASTKYVKDWVITNAKDGSAIATNKSDLIFRYVVKGPDNSEITFNPGNNSLDEPQNALQVQSIENPFYVYEEALKRFKKLSEEKNFKPVIVYIPSAHITYTDYINFEDQRINKPLIEFSLRQRMYLAKVANDLKITFVDPTKDLQKEATTHRTLGNLLYFPKNMHFTPMGHRIFAEIVNKKLTSLLKTR